MRLHLPQNAIIGSVSWPLLARVDQLRKKCAPWTLKITPTMAAEKAGGVDQLVDISLVILDAVSNKMSLIGSTMLQAETEV